MIDFIKLQPDRLYLSNPAANTTVTVPGFSRMTYSESGKPGANQTLAFCVDRYRLVKVVTTRLEDNRFWVKCIEANLPALVHGHNGRQLADAGDLHLALTRLRHIVAMVVRHNDHDRIVPGIGPGNQGWIRQVECFRQFVDPDQQILRASHFGRMKNQQKPNGVYYGQSTRLAARSACAGAMSKTTGPRGALGNAVSKPARKM